MEIHYSSSPKQDNICTTVTMYEEVDMYAGEVNVSCWVPYSDSRAECAESSKHEAIRLLRLALAELES